MAEERTSIAKSENVLICAGDCAVTVLPRFGGKIASIRVGGHELLQAPLAPIAPRTESMPFDDSDASGWDECLPSVAACRVQTAAGTAEIPDHGDLWRVEWQKQGTSEQANEGFEITDHGSRNGDQKHNSVDLIAKCFSLPLQLERKLELDETERGWSLRLSYRLSNLGTTPVPWAWAAHPLFAVEKGDRILLPESIRSVKLEGSGRERLTGDSVSWPVAKLSDGDSVDLSAVLAADSGVGDKLFAGPLDETENWAALERSSAGLRIRVGFDTRATPYLGLWICYGGWPEKPGPKQVCVALEPSTAPVDSLGVERWSRELAPGDHFSWPMSVEIERIER
jgi:galactose mutarotase-like enzyme